MRRNTHQQQMVHDALSQFQGGHPTAEQIYDYVARSIPTISRATVYRILNQIAEDGAIQRIQIPSTADRYDDHLEHHYHMRCHRCGRIADVNMPVLDDIYEKLPPEARGAITGHDIVFTGLCAECGAEE